MVVYYISYGPPPRRSFWRPALLALLILLALSVAAAVAYGIYELASGGGGGSPQAEADGGVPLAEVLPDLYRENTNTTFWVDTSKSISDGGYLEGVKRALAAVASPYIDEDAEDAGQAPENSRAVLVTFSEVPESLPGFFSLGATGDAAEAASNWVRAADKLATVNRPAYIYDAIYAAHEDIFRLNDKERDNVIVLLTDDRDGGYMVVDIVKPVPCGPDIGAMPEEVCSPVLETVPIDVNELEPCPASMAAAEGEVCIPMPAAVAGSAIAAYYPVKPEEVDHCPPRLGGIDNACVDITVDYQPFNPYDAKPCHRALKVEPGKACVELESKHTRDDLIALLANSKVPNLRVYTIGLGPNVDRISLELLAAAGRGQYIDCPTVDRCQVPE